MKTLKHINILHYENIKKIKTQIRQTIWDIIFIECEILKPFIKSLRKLLSYKNYD